MLHRATIGHAAFEAEKQNNPVSPDSCEWPEEYLNFPAMWFDEWPPLDQLAVRTLGVDPSKGRRDRLGDYSAVTLFGRDRRGVELVEAFLMRRPVEALCAEVVRLSEWFGPQGVALETNQFQELLLLPLREAARRAGLAEPLRTYHFDNFAESKESRIRTLTHPLAQRRFRFKARSPGTQLLVQQMRDWPGGDFDDGPDSLQMARQLAIELSNGRAMKRQIGSV